ncbi:MAG: hypothetical protein H7Y42_07980 [Chitinophagaceae bacterium]|nr:hypothetical protein [Chitinophagaceae bacterium]
MILLRYRLMVKMISLLFITLFVYTAVSKSLDMERFIYLLSKSDIIGRWSDLVAWSIVILEWITAFLLCYSSLRLWGLYCSFGMMILFTSYIAIMLATDSQLPCGCAAMIESLGWRSHLYLNLLLMGVALTGVLIERKRTLLRSRIS